MHAPQRGSSGICGGTGIERKGQIMIEHRTASSVYHAQETDDWCGAAVALTMLSDSDEKAVIEDLRQEAIYQLGHPASGDWSIDPGGLVRALNAKKPGGSRSF